MPYTTSWDVAVETVLNKSVVDIKTGGGESWNESVRKKLSDKTKTSIILLGLSPDYPEGDKIYRYSLKVKNNREASILLSKEYE